MGELVHAQPRQLRLVPRFGARFPCLPPADELGGTRNGVLWESRLAAARAVLARNRPVDTLLLVREDTAMTIALAKDVEDFLEEQVRAGVCADPSELANDVLRGVREQQRQPFEITPELEHWLLEAADKPVSPLTQADFDGIQGRVRNRTPMSQA